MVCYEKNDQIGGNWVFTAGTSHSSVCETTHIISSKRLSEFEDFPMPDHYPDYPSHRQVLAYFQAYAKAFELERHIEFNTEVVEAKELPDKSWELELSDGRTEAFDFLLVANGHHSVPRWPEVEGEFSGIYLHAHSYKSNAPYAGKRVLVVGAGNSGCDCAVEISRVAERVDISIRRPTYIVPKFMMGKPTDTYNAIMQYIPKAIREPLLQFSLKLQIGRYEQYGLPQPDYPVTKAHPTLNSELLYRIRHGKVQPRAGLVAFEGEKAIFADGAEAVYDAVVAATGYRIAFPFFSRDLFDFENAYRIPLYLRMLAPGHPKVFFIGLVQPQGCIWPLSDLQAKLAANHIMGRWPLPDNLQELAEEECRQIERDFLHARRHSLEVHFHPFARKLRKAIPDQAPAWPAKPDHAFLSSS